MFLLARAMIMNGPNRDPAVISYTAEIFRLSTPQSGTQDGVPVTQDGIPVTQDGVLVTQDGVPVIQDGVPVHTNAKQPALRMAPLHLQGLWTPPLAIEP